MRRTLALCLIAVVPTACGCGKPPAPVLDLPPADQIAEMRASTPLIEGFGAGPITEFVVPTEHVPKVLFWLLPGEPDRYSVSQGVERRMYFHVADVLIRTKNGRELRLRCHDWGKNPVAVTPNGKDYYLGRSTDEQERAVAGGVRLFIAINEAHHARQGTAPK